VNPEAIGRETRALLQAWLGHHGVGSIDPRFGERGEKLASAIALWGVRMNLTAEPSEPSELAFHILDSLAPLTLAAQANGSTLSELFEKESRVLDLGAGAGFPGLVLAAATPAAFVLVEARRKRASFLTVTAAEMGLRNVIVEASQVGPATMASTKISAGRSATLGPSAEAPESTLSGFDTVVARAFARPAEFHRMAAAVLRPGGVAVLYANPGQGLAVEAAQSLGMGEPQEFAYSLSRGGRDVDRILALWRKG
jgi:16S rRNA G527 N7-methylase RsmG